jgi:hypothetical protein
MMGESSRHGRRARMSEMFGCTQLVMRKAQIVGTSDEIHSLSWLLGTSVLKLAACTSPIFLFFHFLLVKEIELLGE